MGDDVDRPETPCVRLPLFPGVTVDASHSRDLDDALWAERRDGGWLATVCISDVAGFVVPGCVPDLRAREAGATVYRGMGTVSSMLPRRMSESFLSLLPPSGDGPMIQRRVLAFRMSLSASLDVEDFSIHEGLLDHMGRFDHAGAEVAARDGGPMGDAMALALGLMERRRRRGSTAFVPDAQGRLTDEEGRVVDSGASGHGHVLVQEFMILANWCTAEWMRSLGRPMLFRNHRTGQPHPVDTTAGRAFHSSICAGHAGLAVPAYAWVTSPIRRYADLANHRLLRAAMRGEPSPLDAAGIETLCAHLDETARARDAERAAWWRENAEAVSMRVLARVPTHELDAATMKGVTKVVARSSEAPDPTFIAEVSRRVADGGLSEKELSVILLATAPGFDPLRCAVLDRLAARPPRATRLLRSMEMAGHLSKCHSESRSGTFHHASVAASVAGTWVQGPFMKSSDMARARGRAATMLLARAFAPGWTPPERWHPAEEWTPAQSHAVARLPRARGNAPGKPRNDLPKPHAGEVLVEAVARNRLQEACTARGWPLPDYKVQGQPGAFRSVVRLSTPDGDMCVTGPDRGNQREAIRASAMLLLLDVLNADILREADEPLATESGQDIQMDAEPDSPVQVGMRR